MALEKRSRDLDWPVGFRLPILASLISSEIAPM